MSFDFAVFGASPLALLLSAALAGVHSRSVCRIGHDWSIWPLPRRFDLALRVATRPAAWAQLKLATAETTKLFNEFGKGLVERVDPLLVAETHASVEALAHLRASANGVGYLLEQMGDRSLTAPAQAWRLRDIAMLARGRAEPALSAWGERVGVRRASPEGVVVRRDGTVRITTGGRQVEAACGIVCDDEGLATWLDDAGRGRLLRPVMAQSVLTEPAKSLAAPLVAYLDRGVTLRQQGKGGVTAIVEGSVAPEARLGASLAPLGPLRRAADLLHQRFETVDGAPLVAMARTPRLHVVAGFGDAAVFFGPLLARHFAGVASPAEAAFLSAHDAGRGHARQAVADYASEVP